ncbi:DUF4113 domain-containing protein [Aureimonas ureilytica]
MPPPPANDPTKQEWKLRSEHLSSRYSTNFSELLRV